MNEEITNAVNHLLLAISDNVEDYSDASLHRQIADAANRVREIMNSEIPFKE